MSATPTPAAPRGCGELDEHRAICVRNADHAGPHQGHVRYVTHPDERARQPGIDSEPTPAPTPAPSVETTEFAAMMGRMLAAWARRVALADTYDLAEFIEFGRTYDDAVASAIAAGRRHQPDAWSWAEIGEAAGISRQAAQQRWGKRGADVEASR